MIKIGKMTLKEMKKEGLKLSFKERKNLFIFNLYPAQINMIYHNGKLMSFWSTKGVRVENAEEAIALLDKIKACIERNKAAMKDGKTK